MNAQNSIIICNSTEKVDLKKYMDTYEKSEDIFKTIHITKKIGANMIGYKNKDLDIFFNIYSTKSGSIIYSIYDNYNPKENEILFLFENDDPSEEFSNQSIFFKFGEKITSLLKEKSIDENKIIGFLKCTIFADEAFFYVGNVTQAFKIAEEKSKN